MLARKANDPGFTFSGADTRLEPFADSQMHIPRSKVRED